MRQELLVEEGTDYYRQVFASVGDQPMASRQGPMGPIVSSAASHLGEVTIELASAEARAFTSEALGNRWRETTGPIPEAVEVNFSASAMNPGEDVNVMFSGPDIDDARGTLGGRWGRTRGA